MGYQALLFCPDEKAARAVTQVLSELDFSVVPCTEPFAAVKKLMAEHFDALVVDCDNEQNATLLFKSARNTPSNQTSLAVAVVEGQAGVAKAFRIGANLILTKPINVEQAKGTLRVARGLLRKSEATKTGPAAGSVPAKPVSATPRPAPQVTTPSVIASRPAASAPQRPAPGAAMQSKTPVEAAKTFTPEEAPEVDVEILDTDDESPALPAAAPSASPIPANRPVASITSEHTPGKEAKRELTRTASPTITSGAASAPAPARDTKAASSTEASKAPAKMETPKDAAAAESAEAPASTSMPAPSFTFGGVIETKTEANKGGSKKLLLAVAAVVVVAGAGYAAWTQFGHPSADTSISMPAVRPAVKTTAPLPQPNPAPATALTTTPSPSATVNSASPVQPPADTNVPTEPTPAKSHSPSAHEKKPSAAASKPAPAAPGTGKIASAKPSSQPIMIKSGGVNSSAPSTDAAAPSVDGVVASNSALLPNLMVAPGSAPTPVLQTVKISQGVSQGLLLKKTAPVYPPNALRLRREGPVQLEATISKTGDISAIKIISGDPLLAHAAADAVKQWKYKPYELNGAPVEIQTPITVNFKLP